VGYEFVEFPYEDRINKNKKNYHEKVDEAVKKRRQRRSYNVIGINERRAEIRNHPFCHFISKIHAK